MITFTKQNYVLINANFSRQTCTTQLLVGNSGVGERVAIPTIIIDFFAPYHYIYTAILIHKALTRTHGLAQVKATSEAWL